jgi:hypothetical protein
VSKTTTDTSVRAAMFCDCTDVGRETQYSTRSSPTANQTGEAHGNPQGPSDRPEVIGPSTYFSPSVPLRRAICRTRLNFDGALLHSREAVA